MNKAIDKLFKNKDGTWYVIQFPNLPLIIWLISEVINYIFKNSNFSSKISTLGTIFLSIWAYLEITTGKSLFRQILGSLVLLLILIGVLN